MNDKYIVYFISKTKKKMTKFIENKLKERGIEDLAPSYGNILTILYDHDQPLRMKDIGQILGKEKSTISSLINNLEKDGYIKKSRSQTDKRNTYIVLTDKAIAIEKEFHAISSEVQKTAYDNFSAEEKKEFLRLLKKMNQNFKV